MSECALALGSHSSIAMHGGLCHETVRHAHEAYVDVQQYCSFFDQHGYEDIATAQILFLLPVCTIIY